jgi:predicted nucleic acid-binding protein
VIFVDSNILLDVVTDDAKWREWSLARLEEAAIAGEIWISDVVYAEVSIGFSRIELVDRFLDGEQIRIARPPREALFLAGKAFQSYRRRGGTRTSVLPDFLIGAHAAVAATRLLTRDPRHYRTYFPTLELLIP